MQCYTQLRKCILHLEDQEFVWMYVCVRVHVHALVKCAQILYYIV